MFNGGINISKKGLITSLIGGLALCGCVAKTALPTPTPSLIPTHTPTPSPTPIPIHTPVPYTIMLTHNKCEVVEHIIQPGDTAYDLCEKSCIARWGGRWGCIDHIGEQVRSGDPGLIGIGEVVELYVLKDPLPRPTLQTIELSPLEAEFLSETNKIRTPLVFNQDLYRVAEQRVEDMISTREVSHDINKNGESDFSEVMEQLGLCPKKYCYGGELLTQAYAEENGEDVVKRFMASEGHRNHLLDEAYKEIGVCSKLNEADNWIYVAVILGF